jgi:hypothetical protein
MGKILVIVILVLAVVGCGLIGVYTLTATNWKAAVEDYKKELDDANRNNQGLQSAYQNLLTERDKMRSRVTDLAKELNDAETRHKKELEDQKDLTKAAEAQAQRSKALETAATSEAARLREEVVLHRKTKDTQDKLIDEKNNEIERLTNRAVEAENLTESLKVRTQTLLDQITVLNQKLAKTEAGAGASTSLVRSSTAKNPPTVFVKGSVTNVLKDSGLIEVDLGSDDGVNDGNTLEVYRLKPKPAYLGTIKILDAHHHKAVGRLLKTEGAARRGVVIKGDLVASKIVAR